MTKKIQLQTNGKEWQVVNGEQVLVDVEKQDIDPITDSSCVQIEGFRTLEEAVSDNKMLSQNLTYTKVMDKVGGDYHQNVLDGQYSKAILYGNTQVNLCEEDTSSMLQIPTTFTSFNNGELRINNKENQVVAPLIKGVTMINLAQTNSSLVESGKGVPITNVKGNIVYTLSFKFTTKNTLSGVVVECYDISGKYLGNAESRTNLEDIVKFTFTTFENTSKIHICNNAAYGGETIQLDEIMLIEGDQTALDIPFFKGMKSVELVRPLTNLFANDTPTAHSFTDVTNNNGQVTVTSQSSATWTYACFNITFKSNTSYIVMWDSLSYTQTGNANQTIAICYGNDIIANIDNNFTNKRSIIFNTGDRNPSDINLRIHATTKNTETGTTTVKGLRVFEYDDYLRSVDLQSIGYFSGTKNVAIEPVKTCNKNLYPYGDINFTPTSTGWFDAKGTNNMYGDIAQKSKCRFLLRKGTYKLSSDYYNRTNLGYMSLVTDKEEIIGDTTFTLDKDTYLTLRLQPVEANVPTTLTNIQIERGETATDYVAHDSRCYEPNGQNAIVLRSLPSGVCDTFNLQTGEYTRRIGEIVLDGSENWTLNKPLGDGSFNQFVVNRVQAKKIIHQEVVCDKLISCYHETVNNAIWIYDGAVIVIQSSHANANELKTWLQQNPLTVQYEFREPTTAIIPRTIKRNNNGTVSTIDFGTHTNKESLVLPKNPSYLTINSMTSIKPVVEPITYIDFKTRLKTNTDYSVIIDKDNINKTINLGGTSKTYVDKMLVRTPSINLEQNLRISGNGSIQNIMVIEGDVLNKELPYFNGMCNVKMPIVRNTGKNLFNFDEHKSNWWFQGGQDQIIKGDDTGIPYSALIPISPLYYYKIQADNWDRRYLVFLDANFDTISWEANVNTTSLAPLNARYLLCYLNSKGISRKDNIIITATKDRNNNTISYEPYRGNNICIAQGEIGLSQDMFEQGGFSGSSGNTYDNCKANTNTNIRMRTKGLITVKPNTTYIVNNNTSPNMNHVFYLFDESQKYLGDNITVNTKSFVTPNNCRYVSLMFSKDNNANISVSEFKQELFQLLELDSTVQLRSLPNGVKDELNLLTGEYIQRVGEIVLDGSENWAINNTQTTTTNRFILKGVIKSDMTDATLSWYMVDKLPKTKWSDSCQLGITLTDGKIFLYNNSIEYNISALKTWLSQNPITVQYELAEPIISYPRIVSNTQEREVGIKLPNGVCDTYNPSTGITIKRVGKVVLDGSEKYNRDTSSTKPTDLERFNTSIKDMVASPYNTGNFVVETSGYNIVNNDTTSPRKLPNVWNYYKASIYLDFATTAFGMATSDSTDTKISKLKTYLSSNPITIYYELANPIVTTDIVLPNGVHDEYNPLTGLYTKRVGYIELDGGETNLGYRVHSNGYLLADMNNIKLSGLESEPTDNILSNILVNSVSNIYQNTDITTNCIALHHQSTSLMIKVMNISTVDEYKTYLSQNPLKVWYELSTPITYQLTPYFGLPTPYAYKDGHLIMDSTYNGQTLPPEFKYQVLTNRTGQITQNNIKLKEHTARLSNLEYILIEATLDSIFDREMQNFELELMNVELLDLNE